MTIYINYPKLYMMIKVLKAGFYSAIQDKGRFGFANIGVPIAGVMDSYATNLANHVLHNNLACAVLEIAFNNAVFQFVNATQICISGADFSAKINGKLVKLNAIINVKKDDVLSFGTIKFGARTYVAVAGGFQSETILGSRSMFKEITKTSQLKNGDVLLLQQQINLRNPINASIKVNKNYFEDDKLFCLKGPEFDLLSEKQQHKLCNTNFSISNDINRMGYRLNELITHSLSGIVTSAVLPGTVQLTPSGKLIVLMKDCQVTGGYPRILQLKENSLGKLAQKKPTDKICFVLH